MTYALFLVWFLCLPTALLLVLLRGRLGRGPRVALWLTVAIAFFYTTPWDNYAASRKLWSFDPRFVFGKPLWLWHLPAEEYAFYVAEAIFVCLTVAVLGKSRLFRDDVPDSSEGPI